MTTISTMGVSIITVGIAVGIGIFVGYCYYFDQQRRNDPDFKKKLRQRRKARKEAQKTNSKIPNLKDNEVIQNFFVQEVQLGEDLLGQGDIESGVEHLANAVAICGQPNQLLQVLQRTLPPEIFHRLLLQLPIASQKLKPQSCATEEDVE